MISFNTEDIKFSLARKRELKQWLKQVATSEGYVLGELSYIFCSDEYLLQINREYLQHDYYTDVITFDYTEGKKISGDIFISIDTVRKNAELYSQSFLSELYRVMVHGLLHLCGYPDAANSEKLLMAAKEDAHLSSAPLF